MNWFKRHYNRISAKKHSWHPSWFAPYLSEFDNELQDSIIKFQVEHDLKPDGLVGPITYRRLLANRELRLENKKSENYILINGQPVAIGWCNLPIPRHKRCWLACREGQQLFYWRRL